MAKRSKAVKPEIVNRCQDCVFCEPYTKRFLNWKGEPILRKCPYDKYLAFMDKEACSNNFRKN